MKADVSFTPQDSIQTKFEAFHKKYPQVYAKLVELARTAQMQGVTRYGIQSLFELLRWHYTVEIKLDEPFKLNNDFASRYARLIMQQEEDLEGFFEVRVLNQEKKAIKKQEKQVKFDNKVEEFLQSSTIIEEIPQNAQA